MRRVRDLPLRRQRQLPGTADSELDQGGGERRQPGGEQQRERVGPVLTVTAATEQGGELGDRRQRGDDAGERGGDRGGEDVAVVDLQQTAACFGSRPAKASGAMVGEM